MNNVELEEISLIGLSLQTKTINEGGKSNIDCIKLWQDFQEGNYAAIIPDKLREEIYGVYYEYEGDSTKPFSYFIGCKVKKGTKVPKGLINLIIPKGIYHKIIVKGKMPDCVIHAWKEIWISDIQRSYQMDFEVYDERTKDWNNAEIDVYLSIKNS